MRVEAGALQGHLLVDWQEAFLVALGGLADGVRLIGLITVLPLDVTDLLAILAVDVPFVGRLQGAQRR